MLNPNASAESLLNVGTLAIAQVGDSVFELMVRTRLCLSGAVTAGILHKQRVKLVNASSQAAQARKILPSLTDEEQDIFRRGRNTQVGSVPKLASREDYQAATALETLWGWLYLTGKTDRLEELFNIIFDVDGEL